MNSLLSTMARAARNRPGRVVAVLAIVTAVLGGFSAYQTSDTDMAAFAPSSDLSQALDRVEDTFVGETESVQIIVESNAGSVTDAHGIRSAADIIAAVAATDAGVAVGPDGAPIIRSFADAALTTVDPSSASDAELDAAGATTYETPSARMLSNDADPISGTARGGLITAVLDGSLSEQEVETASLAIADAVDQSGTDALSVRAFNGYILGAMMQADSEDEMGMLLAISLLLILGILFALYRTVSDVIVGFVGLLVSIVWMSGIAAILGPNLLGITGPFTQMAMAVPILLVGLGIDYSIHLTARYREERSHGVDAGAGVSTAIRTVGGALVLATITTVVGFLTNLSSPLPPMGDFGVFTAAGVLSAFIVMTLLVPSARKLLDDRRARAGKAPAGLRTAGQGPGALARLVGRTAVLAQRAPKATLAVALVLTIAAAGSATRIETSFSQDDFIPSNSDAGRILDSLDNLFAGDLEERTYVLLDGDLATEDAMHALAQVQSAAATTAGVRHTDGDAHATSPLTLLHTLAGDPAFAAQAGAFGLGPDGDLAPGADVSGLLRLAHDVDPALASQVIAPDLRSGLLTFDTSAGQDGAEALHDALSEAVTPLAARGVDTMITSEPLMFDDTLAALTASQTRGIVITLIAAMLLLSIVFWVSDRRPVLGVITMIPSVAVVAWVLGIMPVLGINLNMLTAMVASIGIGIGVPYGIHVTHRFLEDRRRADSVNDAVAATVTHTGGAMAGSAATTAAGFGVLVFASLAPMRQFGGIIAITIILSVLAAVLVQPACLRLWADHRARRGDTGTPLDHELRELLEEQRPVPAGTGTSR